MLPIEWCDRARAAPGKILVEREKMPEMAGKLWLPPHYRSHTLSSTAMVIDDSRYRDPGMVVALQAILNNSFSPPERLLLPAGMRVVLSASAGKPVTFGARGERTLWSVSPEQIMLILTEDADTRLDANPMRAMNGEIHNPDLADVVDEGDARSLR